MEASHQHQYENLRQSLKILSSIEIETLYSKLSSSVDGLSESQFRHNYEIYGPNSPKIEREVWIGIEILKRFIAPLPLLLLMLSLLTYITGESKGALVIAVMVIFSILFGFIQEYKSSEALKRLTRLVRIKVQVLRGGNQSEVDLTQVVPGEIIYLSVGDLIPADIRVLTAKDLFINQSALTGESFPVEKSPNARIQDSDELFELDNLAFMGSHVVSGVGTGIAINTGPNTLFAGLASDMAIQKKHSSFDLGIEKFTWLMIQLMAWIVLSIFLLNGLIKGDWLEAGLFAIAVGVGLAPEMLPMLVTINLSKGAISLSKKHVIIKRLSAIQSLGAMNILCSDKTGTLTQDQIILERYIDIHGNADERVLKYSYLNSHYQSGLRNLLDLAILRHVDIHQKLHQSINYQKIDEIPFDFQRRRMSVILRTDRRRDILICKGAVEEIVDCCKYVQSGDHLDLLSNQCLSDILKVSDSLNMEGFRVIAVAIREEDSMERAYQIADESNLTLLGYVAFLDPPKESARSALAALHSCGVNVKILTGDNALISNTVCTQVGLNVGKAILGKDIDSLSEEELGLVAMKTTLFAKMTPQHKARVIRALQMNGNVVGYMGDGINDGPGLVAADVSISVDSAVDIAKESADIILLNKSLTILHQGVIEGRRVFANIMKYIKMSASSNFGNMLSMCGASVILPFLPMAPSQILLNNLLYDISQTAVAGDAVDEEYLRKPRSWDISGLKRYIFYIGPISSVFDYLTFAFLWFSIKANTAESAAVFQTGWFIESLLSQTLVVHIIRTGKIPFLQSSASHSLIFATLLICAIGIALPYSFMASSFHLSQPPLEYWVFLSLLIPIYLFITQLAKAHCIKRWGLL